MTRPQRNKIIAILFLAAFVLIMTGLGARSAEWTQTDRDGSVWIVLIPHPVDHDAIEESRKAIDVRLEIVTYGASWTRMTLSKTETTDWQAVMDWIETL